MSNQTEFDKELERLKEQMWDAAQLNRDNPLGYHVFDAHFNTFKQAVDTYVIGKDLLFGLGNIAFIINDAINQEKNSERLALWGDK